MRLSMVLAVAVLACPTVACSREPKAIVSPAGLAVVPLTVTTSRGKTIQFKVEVARTEAQQARGLMFRTKIPAGTGMIFPLVPPRVASFWMKDCPVPEDMIFIRADGTIARIVAETIPFSLDPVESGEPVAAVFEIAGGQAAALGIAEDDKVSWPKELPSPR